MSVITGRAKKFDGTPIDYVSIFNWSDGKCIAQIIPDSTGAWAFNHSNDLNVGITYVANGCEPITHGAYYFASDVIFVTSGYLLLVYAATGNRNYPFLDKTQTQLPSWKDDFGQVLDIGGLSYTYSSNQQVATANVPTKIINQFDIEWTLTFVSYNDTSNTLLMTAEILSEDDKVLAAFKMQNDSGGNGSRLWYGLSLNQLNEALVAGSNPRVIGDIVFTNNGFSYLNKSANGYSDTQSFSFACNLSFAAKLRVAGSAQANTLNSESGGWIKIIKKPV